MRGFDDRFLAPHSRYTDIPLKEVLEKSNLQVIAQGNEVGLSIIASPDMREVYSFGHLEYDRDTLAKEYHRDVKAGLDPALPKITLMRMMPIQNLAFVGILLRRPSLVLDQLCGLSRNTLPLGRIGKRYFILWLPIKGHYDIFNSI